MSQRKFNTHTYAQKKIYAYVCIYIYAYIEYTYIWRKNRRRLLDGKDLSQPMVLACPGQRILVWALARAHICEFAQHRFIYESTYDIIKNGKTFTWINEYIWKRF